MSVHQARPLHLPLLPIHPNASQWSATVNEGYRTISDAYDDASQLLRLEDQAERLTTRILPILHEMSHRLHHNQWSQQCNAAFSSLIEELNYAAMTADSMYTCPFPYDGS